MPGGREAVDVADLGDDQHRGVATDPADLGQHVDAIVGFGLLLDLAGGGFDSAAKVCSRPCSWRRVGSASLCEASVRRSAA